MNDDFFSRSEALLGADKMQALSSAQVLLFGVGGVGSWCAETLIRTGLKHLTIVDGDLIQSTNINRQLPALISTIGQPKVEVLRNHLLTINPEATITSIHDYYQAGDTSYNFANYNYVIDAIDNVAAKTDIIVRASRVRGVKLFCSMGAALRFDPTKVTTGELMDIKGDALAKAVRARMKRIDMKPYRKVKCVYSTEVAQRMLTNERMDKLTNERTKGSLMQVTAVFGCTLASMVINDIAQRKE